MNAGDVLPIQRPRSPQRADTEGDPSGKSRLGAAIACIAPASPLDRWRHDDCCLNAPEAVPSLIPPRAFRMYQRNPSSLRWFSAFAVAVLGLVLLLALAPALRAAVEESTTDEEDEAIEAAIIYIEVTTQRGDWFSPWQPQRAAQASGSGFLISKNRVMTNAHVVSDARQIIVRRNN